MKNSNAMQLSLKFLVPMKARPSSIVLKLLHLKMEVTVSGPCDVIRVGARMGKPDQIGEI